MLKPDTIIPEDKNIGRQCRDCKAFLPKTRYFKCFSCQPPVSFADDFVYHGSDDGGIMDDFDLDDVDDFFAKDIEELAKTIPKEDIDD